MEANNWILCEMEESFEILVVLVGTISSGNRGKVSELLCALVNSPVIQL
jgi:hypothetical protein